MRRRLTAILVADVAGYSGLMERDEEGTAARMSACRAIADAEIAKAEGRLFKAMGDAVLAVLIDRLIAAGLPRAASVANVA